MFVSVRKQTPVLERGHLTGRFRERGVGTVNQGIGNTKTVSKNLSTKTIPFHVLLEQKKVDNRIPGTTTSDTTEGHSGTIQETVKKQIIADLRKLMLCSVMQYGVPLRCDVTQCGNNGRLCEEFRLKTL